jgi:hypothetical protein
MKYPFSTKSSLDSDDTGDELDGFASGEDHGLWALNTGLNNYNVVLPLLGRSKVTGRFGRGYRITHSGGC